MRWVLAVLTAFVLFGACGDEDLEFPGEPQPTATNTSGTATPTATGSPQPTATPTP